MRLKIHSIENKGKPDKECIWLDVLEAADLSYYVVCDTTYVSGDRISNKLRHTYWFPPHGVAREDWVRLVTGKGQQRVDGNDRGTRTHTFYWNLGTTIWNNEGDCAVLFELANWETKRA